MHIHHTYASLIPLAGLLLASVLPIFVETTSAQTGLSYYWVTVNPMAPGFIVHSPVGKNWTISFQAMWTYGNNSGQAIGNATVSIEVKTTDNTVIETLLPKTNATGFISFYYSFPTPNALTFTPTKLVTEDGVEWNQSLLENEPLLYGFQSKPIKIYWDSFDISLISTDTNSLGVTRVSVNVTYFMIPEEGLNISQPSNYSRYDHIPKYVHGANVKINGAKAEESSLPGAYTAETSTWPPTAYILVEISQEGWPQTLKAFSFTHNANKIIWASATVLGFIFAVVPVTYHFVSFRKRKGHALSKETELPIVGAFLLIITSFISMYWTLVGIEGALHGFDWMFFGIFGMISSALGLAGSVMAKRRKNFALTMIAVCFPLAENTAAVRYSFYSYQLATPWMAVALAFIISTLSVVLVGRSDEEFS